MLTARFAKGGTKLQLVEYTSFKMNEFLKARDAGLWEIKNKKGGGALGCDMFMR
jgi:hypothetical protein